MPVIKKELVFRPHFEIGKSIFCFSLIRFNDPIGIAQLNPQIGRNPFGVSDRYLVGSLVRFLDVVADKREFIANKWVVNHQCNGEITVTRNSRGPRDLRDEKKNENNKDQPGRAP